MQYFTYITWHYAKKNKLDVAVTAYLEERKRRLINENDIDFFKALLLEGIKNLERQNPRCKPLNACWRETNEEGDLQLDNVNCLKFEIYKSINTWPHSSVM